MTAKDNEIEFLRLRCKALEEENERLKAAPPVSLQGRDIITFADFKHIAY